MVESSDPRNRDDLTHFLRLDRSLFRSVLSKPEMGPVRVVVVNIRPDNAPKLAVINRHHMIQAVSS